MDSIPLEQDGANVGDQVQNSYNQALKKNICHIISECIQESGSALLENPKLECLECIIRCGVLPAVLRMLFQPMLLSFGCH